MKTIPIGQIAPHVLRAAAVLVAERLGEPDVDEVLRVGLIGSVFTAAVNEVMREDAITVGLDYE